MPYIFSTSEPIIACSCDTNYIDHLFVFIKSLRKYCGTPVWVRCINMSSQNRLSLSQIPNVYCFNDTTNLLLRKTIMCRGIDGGHPRMKSFRSRLHSEHHCYCAHSKFNNVDHLFRMGYEHVLAMDVDAIVKGDLSNIFERYKNNDIVINYDKRISSNLPIEYPVFKEGVMLVKKTKLTTTLFRYMTCKLNSMRKNKDKMYHIDSDHEQLGYIYTLLKQKYTFEVENLDTIYKDTEFRDNTIVWSGKGDRKDTNETYISTWLNVLASCI